MSTTESLIAALGVFEKALGHRRQPAHQSAVALAVALSEERDTLVDRLERRWAWCDANTGHDLFIDREDAVLADLATYETMQTALDSAASVLWGGNT